MKITDKLNDKDVLIWGYGREGRSTERFIKDFCSVKSVEISEAKPGEVNTDAYDLVIKSPGIKVDEYKDNFTSQTELFLGEFADRTIGITGTKGKSTTVSMLYKVLSACLDKKVLLVGNVGLPCLDHYSEMQDGAIAVYEMSCHQLSHIRYSPHIAVFLNLYEDHLDYYGTRENYFRAKSNIALHQSDGDCFIYGETVPEIETPARKVLLPFASGQKLSMKLMGEHNQYNGRVVDYIATALLGCDEASVQKEIEDFTGLSHRMEFVASINGVDYYDDSISTIPEATISAATSVPHAKTLLIGGMDRNIHYDLIVDFIKKNPQYYYIFSYDSGRRIYDEVKELENCFYEEDLATAVRKAKAITPEGTACILSPAAASYGYFKNFEERGEVFKELVKS